MEYMCAENCENREKNECFSFTRELVYKSDDQQLWRCRHFN